MESEDGATAMDLLATGMVADPRALGQVGDDELKMWLLVRKDLRISAEKLMAQAGHAFFALGAQVARAEDVVLFEKYVNSGQAKIVVGVKDSEQLLACVASAELALLPSMCVTDAGRTELEPGTLTVAAIGPCRRSELPGKIKRLRIYRYEDQAANER